MRKSFVQLLCSAEESTPHLQKKMFCFNSLKRCYPLLVGSHFSVVASLLIPVMWKMLTISNMLTGDLLGQMFPARGKILENSKGSLGPLLLFLHRICLYWKFCCFYTSEKVADLFSVDMCGIWRYHAILFFIPMMAFPKEFACRSNQELDCAFFSL